VGVGEYQDADSTEDMSSEEQLLYTWEGVSGNGFIIYTQNQSCFAKHGTMTQNNGKNALQMNDGRKGSLSRGQANTEKLRINFW